VRESLASPHQSPHHRPACRRLDIDTTCSKNTLMSEDHFKGLSAEQRENALAALPAPLAARSIDAIAPVAGGASTASTFRIDSGGQRYLLRMDGRAKSAAAIRINMFRCVSRPRRGFARNPLSRRGRPHRRDRLHRATAAARLSWRSEALAGALERLAGRASRPPPVFPHFVNYPDIVTRLFRACAPDRAFAAGVLVRMWCGLSGCAKRIMRFDQPGLQPQ